MRKMKKSAWALVCGLALMTAVACDSKKNGGSEAQKNSEKMEAVSADKEAVVEHDATELKTRVESIYNDVTTTYNKYNESEELSLGSVETANLDKKYCSEEWNALLEKVAEKDKQNEDEIGFFDFDYWISGQDFQNLKVTDVKVQKIEGDKATVILNLHNFGSVTPMKLDMVYERDNWFIDNFTYISTSGSDEDEGLKRDMQEYIK